MAEEQHPIAFAIKELRTIRFAIENFIEPGLEFDPNRVTFETTTAVTFAVPEENVAIDIQIKLFLDKDKANQKGMLHTRTVYHIRDFNNAFKVEGDRVTVPDAIMVTFVSIAVSSTRGILAAKTEGTIFHNSFFPVIEPARLMPKKETAAEPNEHHTIE